MSAFNRVDTLLDLTLVRLARLVLRHPLLWVLLACVACGLSLTYTWEHLGINTDTTGMLSADLPFQKNRFRLERTFPQDVSTLLLVVEADTPEQADRAIKHLEKRLRSQKDAFQSVYIPGSDRFFEQQALLYLDLSELNDLSTKLSEAQPFIGRLSRDNSLSELVAILGQALKQTETTLPVDLDPLLEKIRTAIEAILDGEAYQLSWQQLMLGNTSQLNATQRFILVKPVFDFSQMVPAEKAITTARGIAEELQHSEPGVRIRFTGEVAMEYDELNTLSHDTAIAGTVSLLLVCASLLIGLRSVRLMLVTLITLITGLVLSAGFAAISVGHLNLISIAFAVLYVGLGVDYAIHLCLRYRELIQRKQPQKEALIGSIRTVGPSILLCAITTSIGFFAFIPTDYTGVSELGLISGVSMFIGLLVTLTLLPALLTILPVRLKTTTPILRLPNRIIRFPLRHRRAIRWSALILALIASSLLTQTHFDFNPMNLRDPHSESVLTFKKLLEKKHTSPLTLALLSDDQTSAKASEERLKGLDSVEKTITIMDFIPERQDEKLAIIEELALILGLQPNPFPTLAVHSTDDQIRALKEFMLTLNKTIEVRQGNASETLIRLSDRIKELLFTLEFASSETRRNLVTQLQSSVLGTLPITMNRLLTALDAEPIKNVEALPRALSQRWLSRDGIHRIQIIPKKDLNDIDNLREFVTEVQAIEPDVTDLPVIYLESANAAVGAFQQALISAVAAISVILLIVLRSIKETLIVLAPLLLASLLTGAATVVLNNPFNFANIIVLPLLLGLGVDSGIHMMHRLRHMSTEDRDLLRTSTARGVFFSTLTTVFSFSSLAFIAHAGTASMGLLLAIGIVFTLISTLVVLPALAVQSSNSFVAHSVKS